ncbi:HTTM domain-containing protein [Streptomyces sp. A7024]|uniref:HTTM domain-containing protein n=1 Tax=Streptomyces coryli TaxID=1128680 RepID=A0A6G4UB29_9ACTN|nr:HTTM domain-containing protein [Streptomyces coryli]NGN68588.1 HTTM domain-containing protein [Streptomyces coryli]
MTVRDLRQAGQGDVLGVVERLLAFFRRMTLQPLALYSAASIRIGLGLLYATYLLREYPYNDQLWGPGSPWSPALADRWLENYHWPDLVNFIYSTLITDSPVYFQAFYGLSIIVALLYAAGWHTRAIGIVHTFCVMAFFTRSWQLTDGGDMAIMLLTFYAAFMASGRRWSLDARRHRKRMEAAQGKPVPEYRFFAGRGAETEELRRRFVVLMHNGAMGVFAAQVMMIYCSAALVKVMGLKWQEGTALYYILQVSWLQPFPALNNWMTGPGHLVPLAVIAYLTVFSQLLFPLAVFNRTVKYCWLLVMLGTHIGIIVTMGVFQFSAIMIIGDLVFLPDSFWRRSAWYVKVLRTPRGKQPVPPPLPDPALPEDAKTVPTQKGQPHSARATSGHG